MCLLHIGLTTLCACLGLLLGMAEHVSFEMTRPITCVVAMIAAKDISPCVSSCVPADVDFGVLIHLLTKNRR